MCIYLFTYYVKQEPYEEKWREMRSLANNYSLSKCLEECAFFRVLRCKVEKYYIAKKWYLTP